MARFRVDAFGGMVPIRGDRLLPETAASLAVNTELDSGELRGLIPPARIHRITGANVAYRIRKGDDEAWISSDTGRLDVCRAPIVNDSHYRWYWSDHPNPPKYNTFDRIKVGLSPFLLGIPAPVATPVVTPSGGSGIDETRAYLFTYVSAYGEEGQPSTPTIATGKADGAWLVSGLPTTVPEQAQRNISHVRIYRTITAVSGATDYYPVATVAFGTTSFDDNVALTTIAARDPIESLNWAVPPAGLEGMVPLANGILCGWVGSTLYFSEPYRPWAWPPDYVLSTEGEIVGVGSFGTAAVVLTDSKPYFISGLRPDQISFVQHDVIMPCLSRTSIVSLPDGVLYASDVGLALAGAGGVSLLTGEMLSREEWQAEYEPGRLICLRDGGRILGVGRRKSFMLDLGNPRAAFVELVGLDRIATGWADFYSGYPTLMSDGGEIFTWRPTTGTRDLWLWRSKEYQLPRPINLGWGLITMDDASALPPRTAQWPGITPLPDALPADQRVRFRLFADGKEVMDRWVSTSNPFRLPTGFKAKLWQFELTGRVKVHSVELATTSKELANV